jgi:hypothetical protein
LEIAHLLSALPVIVCRRSENVREETMKAILLSLSAVVVLAIPVSSPAGAAGEDGLRNANAQVYQHRLWSPRKHTYGKRMRAHWGARCKMTGSC